MKKHLKEEFGGSGKFELPDNHQAGMIVPKGGSSCATCKYFSEKNGENHCGNTYWIQWNGGDTRIPIDDPTTYCSDWYEMSDSIKEVREFIRQIILGK